MDRKFEKFNKKLGKKGKLQIEYGEWVEKEFKNNKVQSIIASLITLVLYVGLSIYSILEDGLDDAFVLIAVLIVIYVVSNLIIFSGVKHRLRLKNDIKNKRNG
ncbi:MAG: hypothetical protein ABF289_01420 [Clostridiales bacterium]